MPLNSATNPDLSPGGRVPRPQRLPRLFSRLSWLYLIFVIAIWCLFRFGGDRWWLATALLYGPRWIWALPLVLLIPAALVLRGRIFWCVLVSFWVVLFPIMGFCISWRAIHSPRADANTIRILSCNTDGSSLDVDAFFRLVADVSPDIIACQEFPRVDKPLAQLLERRGWNYHEDGGLFVASRFPLRHIVSVPTIEKWRTLAAFYEVETPGGKTNLVNLHLETPRKGLEALLQGRYSEIKPVVDNIVRRKFESEQISTLARKLQGPILIAGDFNLPADSAIFRDNWSSYTDAFQAAGLGLGHTKFTRKWGIRIDHLLVNEQWQVKSCYVGPDVKSDHRPLITVVR